MADQKPTLEYERQDPPPKAVSLYYAILVCIFHVIMGCVCIAISAHVVRECLSDVRINYFELAGASIPGIAGVLTFVTLSRLLWDIFKRRKYG